MAVFWLNHAIFRPSTFSEKAKGGTRPPLVLSTKLVLFHRYGFYRALLGALATTDAGVHLDHAADIVNEVQRFLLTDVNTQPAAGALIGIDFRPLVAGLCHGSPPE